MSDYLKDACKTFNRKWMDKSKIALHEAKEAQGVVIQNLKDIQ